MVQCFWFQRFWFTVFPFDPNLLNKNLLNPAVSPSCISDWHKNHALCKESPKDHFKFQNNKQFFVQQSLRLNQSNCIFSFEGQFVEFCICTKSSNSDEVHQQNNILCFVYLWWWSNFCYIFLPPQWCSG